MTIRSIYQMRKLFSVLFKRIYIVNNRIFISNTSSGLSDIFLCSLYKFC